MPEQIAYHAGAGWQKTCEGTRQKDRRLSQALFFIFFSQLLRFPASTALIFFRSSSVIASAERMPSTMVKP